MSKRIVVLMLCFAFILEQTGFAQAQPALVQSSIPVYRPLQLRYLAFHPDTNSFDFEFSKGDDQQLPESSLSAASDELIRYFRTGVSLPNDIFWVNLRMGSPDDVIDPALEDTDLGKVLLEADVQLKKDLAGMTDPLTAEGRQYWDKIYEKALVLFGEEEVSVPTAVRPWIVPGQIIIGQTNDGAYIYKAQLDIQLEQDRLGDASRAAGEDRRLTMLNDYSAQLMKKYFVPRLTRRVNSSREYSRLRQVFYSLVLAQWFKERFRSLGSGFPGNIDSGDIADLKAKSAWSKDTYYKQYCDSLQKGEYSRTESFDSKNGLMERVYISGGFVGEVSTKVVSLVKNIKELPVVKDDKGRYFLTNMVFSRSDKTAIAEAADHRRKVSSYVNDGMSNEDAEVVATAQQEMEHIQSGQQGLLSVHQNELEEMSNEELQRIVDQGRLLNSETIWEAVVYHGAPEGILSKKEEMKTYQSRYRQEAGKVIEARIAGRDLKQRLTDVSDAFREKLSEKTTSATEAVEVVKATSELLKKVGAREFVAFVELLGRDAMDEAFAGNLKEVVDLVAQMKEPGSTLADLLKEFPVDMSQIKADDLENLKMVMNTLLLYQDKIKPELPFLRKAKSLVESKLTNMQEAGKTSFPYVYSGEKAMFVIFTAGLIKRGLPDAQIGSELEAYIDRYFSEYGGQPQVTVGMELEVHKSMLADAGVKGIPFVREVAQGLTGYLYMKPADDKANVVEYSLGPSRSVQCQLEQVRYLRSLDLLPDNGGFPVHISVGFPAELSTQEVTFPVQKDFILIANALAFVYSPDQRFDQSLSANAFGEVIRIRNLTGTSIIENKQKTMEIRPLEYISTSDKSDEGTTEKFERLLNVVEMFKYMIAARQALAHQDVQSPWAEELQPVWEEFTVKFAGLLKEYDMDLDFFRSVDQRFKWRDWHAQKSGQKIGLLSARDDKSLIEGMQELLEETAGNVGESIAKQGSTPALGGSQINVDVSVEMPASSNPSLASMAESMDLNSSRDTLDPKLRFIYLLGDIGWKISRVRQALSGYNRKNTADDGELPENDGLELMTMNPAQLLSVINQDRSTLKEQARTQLEEYFEIRAEKAIADHQENGKNADIELYQNRDNKDPVLFEKLNDNDLSFYFRSRIHEINGMVRKSGALVIVINEKYRKDKEMVQDLLNRAVFEDQLTSENGERMEPGLAQWLAPLMQLPQWNESSLGFLKLLPADKVRLSQMSDLELENTADGIESIFENNLEKVKNVYPDLKIDSGLINKYAGLYRQAAENELEGRNRPRIAKALNLFRNSFQQSKSNLGLAIDTVNALIAVMKSVGVVEFARFVDRVGWDRVNMLFYQNLQETLDYISALKSSEAGLPEVNDQDLADLKKIVDIQKNYQEKIEPELPYLRSAHDLVERILPADSNESNGSSYIYDGEKAMFVIIAADMLRNGFDQRDVEVSVRKMIKGYLDSYEQRPLVSLGMELEVFQKYLKDEIALFSQKTARDVMKSLYMSAGADGFIEEVFSPSRSAECLLFQFRYLRKLGLIPDNGKFPVHISIGLPRDFGSDPEKLRVAEPEFVRAANALAFAFTPTDRFDYSVESLIFNDFVMVMRPHGSDDSASVNGQLREESRTWLSITEESPGDEINNDFEKLLFVFDSFKYMLAAKYGESLGRDDVWVQEMSLLYDDFAKELKILFEQHGSFQDLGEIATKGQWDRLSELKKTDEVLVKEVRELVVRTGQKIDRSSDVLEIVATDLVLNLPTGTAVKIVNPLEGQFNKEERVSPPISYVAYLRDHALYGAKETAKMLRGHPAVSFMYLVGTMGQNISGLRSALLGVMESDHQNNKKPGGVDFRVFKPIEIKRFDPDSAALPGLDIQLPADPAAIVRQINRQLDQRIIPDVSVMRGCLLACRDFPDAQQIRQQLRDCAAKAMLLQEESAVETPVEMLALL